MACVQGTASGSKLSRTGIFTDDAMPAYMACWYIFNSVSGAAKVVFSQDDAGTVWNEVYLDTAVGVRFGQGGTDTLLFNNQAANRWYWVCTVFNGTSTPPVAYIKGNSEGLSRVPHANNFAGWQGDALAVFNETGDTVPINGRISDFVVGYGPTAALKQPQVEALFRKPLGLNPRGIFPDVYAYLPLDNATRPGIDRSGFNHHFTVASTLTKRIETPPRELWTPGSIAYGFPLG